MYRKSVPILAALIISGSIQHIQAGDLLAHHQQQELSCGVCHQQENLENALFLVCNDHLLVTHTECMQERMAAGNLNCPVCPQELSEENVRVILTELTGADVAPQAVDEPVFQDDELLQALAESLMLFDQQVARELQDQFDDVQGAIARHDQIMNDADLARMLADGIIDALPAQEQPVPAVQPAQEQPAQEPAPVQPVQDQPVQEQPAPAVQPVQEQPAQEQPAQQDCSICMDQLNDGQPVQALPCAHSFHTDCVNHWLAQNPICPVCRVDVNQPQLIPAY